MIFLFPTFKLAKLGFIFFIHEHSRVTSASDYRTHLDKLLHLQQLFGISEQLKFSFF